MCLRSLSMALAATVAVAAVSAPASAATPIQTGTNSYIFGSSNFNDTTTFTGLTAGSLLRISLSGTTSTTFTSASASFNGATPVSFTPTGQGGFSGVFNVTAGTLNSLLVQAATSGTGSYSGTLTVLQASVPEASTWAMMTLGFGALGYALRRRRTAFSLA